MFKFLGVSIVSWSFALVALFAQGAIAQEEYDIYYRRCTGQLVLNGGNYDNQLACEQREQAEFAGFAGRTMWRVETR